MMEAEMSQLRRKTATKTTMKIQIYINDCFATEVKNYPVIPMIGEIINVTAGGKHMTLKVDSVVHFMDPQFMVRLLTTDTLAAK